MCGVSVRGRKGGRRFEELRQCGHRGFCRGRCSTDGLHDNGWCDSGAASVRRPGGKTHSATVRREGGKVSLKLDGRRVYETEIGAERRFGLGLAMGGPGGAVEQIRAREPAGEPMFDGEGFNGWWTKGDITEWRIKGDRGRGYGDSYLLNPNGEVVAAAGLCQEYLMIYNLDLHKTHRSRPNRRSIQSAEALLGVLQEAVEAKRQFSR